ncbi:site-specific DNA-methyltransferase [Vibrio diabolicus]|uniref:site-specific DNA-methyltransferase n=1 Tax=Vibrio diabolicus TaxID=50719 RepID=UPI0022A90C92|nr:site-specific DNA-methyltransferase [Vibrio diabolicus]MCZ2369624.1 site-specific DNA-methyltransferase [Vibrio diabolicus]
MKKISRKEIEMCEVNSASMNITKLSELFPEVVIDGQLNIDVLLQLCGVKENICTDDRFGLFWPGKKQARMASMTPSTATLRPNFISRKSNHIFIEGDNFEVLKTLQKSYHKKVDVIYIDPPYNTGKDFIYSDNYKDNISNYLLTTKQVSESGKKLSSNSNTSGRYHSNWLNMMYPRLKLARNLLSDDGAIFISIDDNEHSNLKSICDEIFGEDNFVNNIIWQKKYSPSNDAKWLSDNHDFILCYAKNKSIWRPNLLPRSDEALARYKNPDNDPRGPWMSDNLSVKTYSAANDFEITTPSGRKVAPPASSCWRVSKSKLQEMISDNRIWFGEDGKNTPRIKRFLSEVKDGTTPLTIWPYNEVGHNQSAKQELKKIFPDTKDIFDTPKPSSLIKRILDISSKKDSIVLDFFAGSGTTAQAVIEKNLEDSGSRQFILVQLPEPTGKQDYKLISDFTKERIKRVLDNYGLPMFNSFSLDTTNICPWDADFENLEQVLQQATKSIKDGRSSEDVLYEIFLKYGYGLTTPVETQVVNGKTVFVVGAGALFVCLDDEITTDTVEGIAKLKEEYDPETTQVVFKDEGFADDRVKTNAIQILKQAAIDDVKSI